ncbi:unnamed protein product [Psylliodes chrysocephalus]|uniref:Uncharacterized protein n=1 Tax=Psylliodes chrysocephalus TaxID=3402493 RepID=A0A9P0CT39_9CUCU|nr:unnamed protein product [Psylliodes chrysocephala]
MSSEKGNVARTRPQKHKNRGVFKNNLHDTNHVTKMINSIQVSHVCERCKDIIEWKIKYKKYKPLSQAKTCVKCNLKTVKRAYHVMCAECGKKLGLCTKCCQKKDVVVPPVTVNKFELDLELKAILSSLAERRRRTFLRYMDKKRKQKEETEEPNTTEEEDRKDLLDKLKSLQIMDDDDDEDDDDDCDDDHHHPFDTDSSPSEHVDDDDLDKHHDRPIGCPNDVVFI